MATRTQTPTGAIQLVGRGTRNNVFNVHDMNKLIANCDAPKEPYPVISIIGPQSGGKSTLLNRIFETSFCVMDESKRRGQTTQGIWAAISNYPRAVVLDIEGTDSAEVQHDLGFENRSALFALVVSDVIFVNLWLHNVGLVHGIPLLTNIFQERAKKSGPQGLPKQHITTVVFAIRDYDGITPEKVLHEKMILMVNEIWSSIPQTEESQLQKFFKLHVELFPHIRYEDQKFQNKCAEMRRRITNGDLVGRRLCVLPVSDFPSDANELWQKIVQNRTLDLPSQREMRARASCSSVMSDLLDRHFKDSKYQELLALGTENPREFDDKLKKILDNIFIMYRDETQVYGKHIADEIKQTLKTNILHHAEPEFRNVMAKYKTKILEETKLEVQARCGEHITGMKARANSAVSEYTNEFVSKIEGLNFYHDLIDQENFVEKLCLLGRKLAADIKKRNIKNHSIKVTTGVLLGAAGAATGVGGAAIGAGYFLAGLAGSAFATIAASGAAVGSAVLNNKEEEAERSAHGIVEELSADICCVKAPPSSSDQPR